MVRTLKKVVACGIILFVLLLLCGFPSSASEPNGWIPGIEILLPGMLRTITITQEQDFPLDFGQFVILALGYGPLQISLSAGTRDTKGNSTPGGSLVLTGVGISSAGIAPVLKFGEKGDSLQAYVEIGDERSPGGIVWISCWVYPLVNGAPHEYTLSLGF